MNPTNAYGEATCQLLYPSDCPHISFIFPSVCNCKHLVPSDDPRSLCRYCRFLRITHREWCDDEPSIVYLLTYLRTYLLSPYSRVLREKLTGLQLVKEFLAFYGTRRFITAFKIARHLSLSSASSIHSISPHPTCSFSFA
jgi:hypothetical protein